MAIKVNGNTVIDDSRNANVEALNVVSNTANIGTTVYVVANGNVGVGNSAPAHKLRVEGDVSLTGTIHANGSGGSNGLVLTTNGTTTFWSGVPSSANIQEFTASGTWVKPVGSQVVYIQLIGGGGGGGDAGGLGGGGGAYSDVSMLASQLTSNVTVTIGAGGAQSAAGGNTSFGSYLVSGGGRAGTGGYSPPSTPSLLIGANGGIAYFITANTSTRQGQTAQIVTGLYAHANVSDNQANVANVANVVSAFTSIYGGGRGGGGGNTSANNQFLGSREGGGSVRGGGGGGASGFANATQGQTSGSNGGFSYSSNGGLFGNSSTMSEGGNGVDRPANTIFVHGGSGGGGGASGANNVNGSNGGNGGYPGGGGGGGGARGANTANSLGGSGGTGANGYALIITW